MLHSGEYERYLGDSQPDARSKKLLNTEPLKIKLYAEQEEEQED